MNTKKLVLSALMVVMVSGSAAYAGPNGNGKGNNGNGNGNGGSASENRRSNSSASENGRSNNGAIASELKWRNAGHASAQAFLNASPNSSVGKLATLKRATEALNAALLAAGLPVGAVIRDPLIIQAELDLLAPLARSSDLVQADIEDPLIPVTQELLDELAAAQTYEALESELEVSLSLADELAAEAAAAEVVGVADLSEESIDALWSLLEGK